MDIVLELADEHFFDKVYDGLLPANSCLSQRDCIFRQTLSLSAITVLSGWLLYFSFTTFSYFLLYDQKLEKHPKFLKNQKRKEIWLSFLAIPVETLLTVPWFVMEVRGYSKLYSNIADYGWAYFILSIALFLFYTDCLIYWIHRFLHHPLVYKALHKPHHKWKVPTPFASHAFHPIDGYLQSLPYHMFVFTLPMHRVLYIGLFLFVNFWTISIHDGNFVSEFKFINGAAHHTVHHLEYSYNYGQYFTLWDRLGGSFKQPERDSLAYEKKSE